MHGSAVSGTIRITASTEGRSVGTPPDKVSENVNFAAQELLEATADERPTMLEDIAKALTRRLLRDNPGIGAREVSQRVSAFVSAVRERLMGY
jgi:hypothetical protein